MSRYSLGVDIGGTFTDIVLLRRRRHAFSKKLLSTPAITAGDRRGRRGAPARGRGRAAVRSSSSRMAPPSRPTRSSSASGAAVALITTRGFRDVLELGRFRSPRLYDLEFRKPEPLVERRLRFEVTERCDARGQHA